MATATTTRGLCFTLSMMCLVCFANSMTVREKLDDMKEQLQIAEQRIKAQRELLESSRRSISEVMIGNTARVECLKTHSTLSPTEMEQVERYTENTNARVRRSFADMDEQVENQEIQLEKFKAQINFLESLYDEY